MSVGKLPEEWLLTYIEDIADVVGGGTPRANDPDNFVEPSMGISWLTPADLSGYKEKYITHGARDLSEQGYKNSSAKLMPKGTVVFSSRAPIGYVAIASKDMCTNQGFKSFVTGSNIESEYLYYYLKSIKDLAESKGTGTTFKELSGSACKKLPFILIPIAEQKEIVRQLDIMLAKVEQIKTRLEAISKFLKKLKKSFLAQAMSGRVSAEWRQHQNLLVSHAEKDLSQILRERISLVRDKNIKVEQHLKNEEYTIPSTWIWTSLDALTSKIVDGTHHTPKYIENGIPFISVKDIYEGKIDFSNTKYISEIEHTELSKRCNVEKGDLLITKSGTIGRTAIVNTSNEFSLFVSVALLKPASKNVNMEFINIALQKWVNEIDVSSRIVGSAIKNLHLRDMRVLAIPFPPLQEQDFIVRKINEYIQYFENIEKNIQVSQIKVSSITQTILVKAFNGELTAKWRKEHNDLITGNNSAEVLLIEIQQEKKIKKLNQDKIKENVLKQNSKSKKMNEIKSVLDVLQSVRHPLSSIDLFSLANYPNDAGTELIEKFYLDLRESINQGKIKVIGDESYNCLFELG
ncbi:restriction endonuclease subunit S [Acinetobacter sp. AOR15_HL]|uniref:restriction endonuclease subunit S n=1 Tax=unclassified Acinetobacter TaxID=196816 RepID=UPI0022EA5A4C|nr:MULTISPECIES: restriction endonuclease subunit S [unclassified Acinetobacter]MDA3556355.1 restriction endonuclease subunit S [Acinetobacter sp. AOR15_HL]MDA3571812.1 restriction endonuclease subunit S [Acinetobacter sp. AOR14_HL]